MNNKKFILFFTILTVSASCLFSNIYNIEETQNKEINITTNDLNIVNKTTKNKNHFFFKSRNGKIKKAIIKNNSKVLKYVSIGIGYGLSSKVYGLILPLLTSFLFQ